MKIIHELESVFFERQESFNANITNDVLNNYLQTMHSYAEIDGAIVVLSDLVNVKSYICIGLLGNRFGLESDANHIFEIDSIWEEDIFKKVHPDDLFKKYVLELKYAHYLKTKPSLERSKYHTDSRIRMMNISGEYQYVNHRNMHLYDSLSKDLLFSLCIYKSSLNQEITGGINGNIINKEKGVAVEHKEYNDCSDILSSREKEVLRYIKKGNLSKDIAGILSISVNTVNRHRQNILIKLNANNSFEAIKIAKAMDILL